MVPQLRRRSRSSEADEATSTNVSRHLVLLRVTLAEINIPRSARPVDTDKRRALGGEAAPRSYPTSCTATCGSHRIALQ